MKMRIFLILSLLALVIPAHVNAENIILDIEAVDIGWDTKSELTGNERRATLPPGRAVTVGIRILNGGAKFNEPSARLQLIPANNDARLFRHRFWTSQDITTELASGRIPSRQTAVMKFAIAAPEAVGVYHPQFRFGTSAGYQSNITVSFTINVQSPSARVTSMVTNTPSRQTVENVRVAIDAPTSPVIITATQPFTKTNATGEVLGSYRAYQRATTSLEGGAVRFVASNPSAEFVVLSMNRRPAWNPALNDNWFRGSLEVITGTSGTTWLVNELSLEDYMAGIAEVPNDVPLEHAKTMAVAARSYANYYLARDGKHAGEPFHLKASIAGLGDDQVYKGAAFTKRSTTFREAVAATTGEVLLYNGNPAIGVYSSDSGGSAKDARDVWGNAFSDKPYLWGVDAKGMQITDPVNTIRRSAALQRASHGVGISAAGAEAMANRGASYRDILKYYYPGTSIDK
jgi:peptidoglycan hydrolase-like amidase